MKKWQANLTLVLFFLTVGAQARNTCSCVPLPTTKTYLGEARKKHLIGYSIDWSCTYQCHVGRGVESHDEALVTGSYREYHFFQEDGREGICEGMIYEARFNFDLNRYIYSYTGENIAVNPTNSKSADLRKWAETQDCE